MTAPSVIKCFRRRDLAFYSEDYSGERTYYAEAANDDAAYWIARGLEEQRGIPVLDWTEEFHRPANMEEMPRDTVRRLAGYLVDRDRKLTNLRGMAESRGKEGSWNWSGFSHGVYTGLEIALSIMDDRSPQFRAAPHRYLSEQSTEEPTV